jgi:23S rRNA (guanosine2251-2'-O)-methyltransferase
MEVVVVLDNIRSLHNVGSIFRTADSAGVSKIYLSGITPSPLDRFGNYRQQVSKVSLGAEKNVPWEKVESTENLIDDLKKSGYEIFAVEQHEDSIPYYTLDPSPYRVRPKLHAKEDTLGKLALILGHEVTGLNKEILKKTDTILEIPMRGDKESLNVSVAFGIVVFHIIK